MGVISMAYVCECTYCMRDFINPNPPGGALKWAILTKIDSLIEEEGRYVCPICKTDKHLIDVDLKEPLPGVREMRVIDDVEEVIKKYSLPVYRFNERTGRDEWTTT